MPKLKARYVCQSCGHVEPRWMGRCPDCNAWSSLLEEPAETAKPSIRSEAALPLTEVSADESPRVPTTIGELDRVLGGGLVPGSLTLLGGDPGIGKSTLLLQALHSLAERGPVGGGAPTSFARRGGGLPPPPRSVLYVSGEESARQIALRAERLGAKSAQLLVLAETSLERILSQAESLRPQVLAVDSVQTVHTESLESVPGSVSQVREAAGRLLTFAKTRGIPTILVGHVTKEGSLAGPKTLEHIVDTVLAFEGESGHPYRILRAAKNRFGSTQEVGVFEMRGGGLAEVENPSEAFLAERPIGVAGSVVVASAEGTRPILVEVQALVATPSGIPRRTALGVDPARVSLLLAVLDRKAGIDVLTQDVFVNLAGGVRLGEPAVDLGVLCAVASSACSRVADPHTIVFGEVGLAGEVRAVSLIETRLAEAAKLGFKRCVLPEASRARIDGRPPLECIGVRDVRSALEAVLR